MNKTSLRRQRTRTLVLWLRLLNRWEWPKAIPLPADVPDRNAIMRDIEHVLAWRVVAEQERP
jgi:hypothetical protein